MPLVSGRYGTGNKVTKIDELDEKIKSRLYTVNTLAFYARSSNHIKAHGVIQSGIRELDDSYTKERIRIMIPIPKIVDLAKRKVSYGIVYRKDAKEIYETIQAYLLNWVETTRTRLNGKPDWEKLMDLEMLASEIYPFIRSEYGNIEYEDQFMSQFRNNKRVSVSEFFRRAANNPFTKNPISPTNPDALVHHHEPVGPERDSFAEQFKGAMIGRRRFNTPPKE